MTARARSKAYQPILAKVHKWTDKAVIFRSLETQRTFMVPQSVCQISTVDLGVIALHPVQADEFDVQQRSTLLEHESCIAWVQQWKLDELEEKGEGVPTMTPETPKATQVTR